ncbi:MAG: RluA family pseudouridine synthase [Lentisphaerae bacterium]|nr:RluA family pseudouridine synthase [Lentisphaerota bacterium]
MKHLPLPNGLHLDVLLDTPHVLAVNKPEGIAAIPERAGDQDCLRAQMEAALGVTLFVVHRLDKEVSGAIVFARDAESHRFLNLQFSERRVHKCYLALVHGRPPRDTGDIHAPLREFGSGRMGVDAKGGKPSLTRYRVLDRLPRYTLLEAQPVTGRRHQIRVHLYSLGNPLVGDRKYGDRARQLAYPRLMLHAATLRIPLPTGQTARLEASLPASFKELLETLRTET